MSCTNRFFDSEPGKASVGNKNGYFKFAIVIVAVTALCTFWPSLAIAADTYTVDDIAEGMLAAEKRFTDLRLEYAACWDVVSGPNEYIIFEEGVYVEKKFEKQPSQDRLRYQQLVVSTIKPETKDVNIFEDFAVSFDGEATTVLNRIKKGAVVNEAFITAGYDNIFTAYYRDPHTQIWYLGGKLLAAPLKENTGTFHVENQAEIIDGVPTVKLTGTIGNGKITIELWVSPERGFLPVKRQVKKTGGRMLSETGLYELVKLADGMWYPKTIKSPAEPPGAPNPAYIHTYDISAISIDPVPKEFFTMKFPPDIRVYDGVLGITYTTY